MELVHIDLDRLHVSRMNMRNGRKPPSIDDILPSIRERGVLVPLLVRSSEEETFEIVAGRRRYFACLTVKEEEGSVQSLPCAVMETGDDAAALEASLIENVARLDPDEVSQWETFSKLVRQGRDTATIAQTFGVTELAVKRVLALGSLLPAIRGLYRDDEIDRQTVRHLTLATKAKQKAWFALHRDPESYAPTGYRLKAWVLGGESIATDVALFPLEDYTGPVASDLFGEESYFTNAEQFWTLQNTAIEATAEAYRKAGWQEIVTLKPGEPFHRWEHTPLPKDDGGKVFITISHDGEVECHEGWLSEKEARQQSNGEPVEVKRTRPEASARLNTYIDLHRHAAVRTVMLSHPGAALRMAVAHMISGSSLWRIIAEPQRAEGEAMAASVASSISEAAFSAARKEVVGELGFDVNIDAVLAQGLRHDTSTVFQKLLELSDDAVLSILTIVMGETLEAGSVMVEALGQQLGVDMQSVWRADDAFLELVRDKESIQALLSEVAGPEVAAANAAETAKTQKIVLRDCLDGTNGRTKTENWLPRWLHFPATHYTERGGVGAVSRGEQISNLMDT